MGLQEKNQSSNEVDKLSGHSFVSLFGGHTTFNSVCKRLIPKAFFKCVYLGGNGRSVTAGQKMRLDFLRVYETFAIQLQL